MNITPGTLPTSVQPGPRKANARVALFALPPVSQNVMTECFRQFGIETVPFGREQADRLNKEKFYACVLPLESSAGSIIELARGSASNSRMVIYGVGGTARDALRYSKLCLNAVFHEPLERQAALKLVRSTRTLVMHEFRRYLRVPVMTEVNVTMLDGSRLNATSREISTGGMSLRCNIPPEIGHQVEVSFSLLTLPRIWIKGFVAWKKTTKLFGVRFDPNDERRRRLNEWITGYLEA